MQPGLGLLSLSLLVCNPFFLENLSYRYDVLTMSLAVFFALSPWLFFLYGGKSRSGPAITVATLITLNLYQPAIDIFIVTLFFAALVDLLDAEIIPVATTLLLRCCFVLVGLLIYAAETLFLPTVKHSREHDKFVGPDHIHRLVSNVGAFGGFVIKNLAHIHQFQFLFLACLAALLAYIYRILTIDRKQRENRLLLGIVCLLLLAGLFEGVVGPMIFLQAPVVKSRVLLGFGIACGALLALGVAATRNGRIERLTSAVLVLIVFEQMVISYAYGNALSDQAAFQRHLTDRLITHMYRLAGSSPTQVTIRGTEPDGPFTHNAIKTYPVIGTLLPEPLHNAWIFGGLLLRAEGMPRNFKFIRNQRPQGMMNEIYRTCAFTSGLNAMDDNIYLNGHDMVIDFTKHCPIHRK